MANRVLKIVPMQKEHLDEVIKVEEKAYGEHHWSKESFFNELNILLHTNYLLADTMQK